MRHLSIVAVAALGLMIVAQAAQASPVGGTQVGIDKIVRPHSTAVYRVICYADEVTRLALKGDGDTDLDVYVYNADGELITADRKYSDRCTCAWRPRWTRPFTIRVVNRGSVSNRYTIVVE